MLSEMTNNVEVMSRGELTAGVRDVFAQVTRYPLDILDPDSGLEEELGIDSVKLGEVFSVLREKYDLPEQVGIPSEQLLTIAGISDALHRYLTNGSAPSGGNPPPAAHRGNGSIPPAELAAEVREVFAQVTRYPLDILDLEAGLEEELGIDSVKLGEVFSVLREKYDLPEQIGIPPEQLRTIAGISAALRQYLSRQQSAPAPAPDPAPGSIELPGRTSAPGSGNGDGRLARTLAAPTVEPKPFSGKIALITGSGRGLGKDVACYLAELGATVVVNSFHSRPLGIKTMEEIRAAGGEAHHIWASVANSKQLHAMFDEIEETFGGLDFFVSNASNGMLARLEDITPEHWEKAFRTNVVGLHECALRAVKLMRKRGGGKIITLSSPASHGYVDYFGCMGAVKAAVESLTRSLAIEFSPDNIQINCVSPGPVYGELLKKWPDSERLIAQWEENTAYERLCEARDVSHFIAYLLSEPVKLFAGSVLVMDGGISSQGW